MYKSSLVFEVQIMLHSRRFRKGCPNGVSYLVPCQNLRELALVALSNPRHDALDDTNTVQKGVVQLNNLISEEVTPTNQHYRYKIESKSKGVINTMKIIVIKPFQNPYVATIKGDLESMQKIVGGYIEAVYPFDDP